jgi:hypothetical protein
MGLHHPNFSLIQAAVFKHVRWNDQRKTPDLGIFLKLVGNGLEYDHRSFVIDKVALIPWALRQGSAHVMIGFCVLPGGTVSSHMQDTFYCHSGSGKTLPPGFDLHRYITHLNRGITHFHGSFWPLPRRLSDTAFESAEPPPEWVDYMSQHSKGFDYNNDFWQPTWRGFQFFDRYRRHRPAEFDFSKIVTEVFAVEKRDGTRVEQFKYDQHASHFGLHFEAITKVDPTEFKKFLDDPSRRLCMVPACECPSSFYTFFLTRRNRPKEKILEQKLKQIENIRRVIPERVPVW